MRSHHRARRFSPAFAAAGRLRSLLIAAALAAFASSASAQARVVVELKDKAGNAAEGEVSLHAESGARIASCTTVKGQCEMSGVPGGNYEVRVKPASGAPAPKPRSAMIPPEGTAKLIVSTGS